MSETRSAVESDSLALGASLGPALREAVGGRLSEITWFRSTWQQGGAATGFASWTGDGGEAVEAMVKLPVGPTEYLWTSRLGACEPGAGARDGFLDGPTPRVLACGRHIGGYDLAWLIVEKLAGQPLSRDLNERGVLDLLDAAAEFYRRAAAFEPPSQGVRPPAPDWAGTLEKAREHCKTHNVPEGQRWNEAIKKVQRHLEALEGRWARRTIDTWCHGDLHPGNAMRRPMGEGAGRCVLIDLALVHPGCWVEDAIYLERMYWGRPEALAGVKPLSALARAMREKGLNPGSDYADLANIRRVLMAAGSPAYLAHEGHPKYLHAALEVIERLLLQVIR